MIENLIIFLEVLLIFCLWFQPSESRLYTGAAFIGMIFFHELFFSEYEGLLYHGTAALFYLAIMVITGAALHLTRLVIDIHKICLASIIINAIGWVFWYAYFPPIYYNLSYLSLHCWAVYVLMQRTKVKDNEFRVDGGRLSFRPNLSSCSQYLQKYKG